MNGMRRPPAGALGTVDPHRPLLVVERDRVLAHLDTHPLVVAGAYGPIRHSDHAHAAEQIERMVPAAVVLQLLPDDPDCLDVLDAIPHVRSGRPVVVAVSPTDAIEMRVMALERGADDYVTDPLRVDELLARLDTARRRREVRRTRYLRLGAMLVDTETGRVGDGMNWTWLTPKEWRVFEVLIDRRDQLVPRQHLKQVAFGTEGMSDNALEAMICRLRAKAGDLGVRIRAQRGVGYRLEPEPLEAGA